jgi:hypothetical protein
VFGLMLEDLGVRDVPALAARDPAGLHARLFAHNREERLARRSPTPGEVADRGRYRTRLSSPRHER